MLSSQISLYVTIKTTFICTQNLRKRLMCFFCVLDLMFIMYKNSLLRMRILKLLSELLNCDMFDNSGQDRPELIIARF